MIVSRRTKQLWKPNPKIDDFYDSVFGSKKSAEETLSYRDKRYYMAIPVKVTKL